jgi:hypothetical protein
LITLGEVLIVETLVALMLRSSQIQQHGAEAPMTQGWQGVAWRITFQDLSLTES